jgi:1,4-alpha-glucan branching enzyme
MRAPAADNGMGSLLTAEGCRFRVWAPNAKRVQVVGDFTATPLDLALDPGTGNWSGDQIPAKANDRYKFVITNRGGENNDDSQLWYRADARALQVESAAPEANSYIVPPFTSDRSVFTTPPFNESLIYQLHVGSFAGHNDGINVRNNTATFLDLISKLDYIRNLGFNIMQLLPVNTEQGSPRGAGEMYGPSDLYALANVYATDPSKAVIEFLQLIDAAHSKGLAVILDVIYAHAGPRENRYWRYDGNYAGHTIDIDGKQQRVEGGIYFVNGHHTQWGEGFALWQPEVRDFILDNARLYLRDHRVDGLRFDAVQAIQPDALKYIVGTLRNEFPDKYLIAEFDTSGEASVISGDTDPYKTFGFSATWDLPSPWQTFDILQGGEKAVDAMIERIGDLNYPEPWRSVSYMTGAHDQVFGGMNRPGIYITERFGGRSNPFARAKSRLAWALNATLPATPMIFMGTEGHLDGHWDPAITDADRRIDWAKMGDDLGAPMQRLVRDINNLRWRYKSLQSTKGSIIHVDRQNAVVAFRRENGFGEVLLIVIHPGDLQFGDPRYELPVGDDKSSWREIFNSQASDYGGDSQDNASAKIYPENSRLPIQIPAWSLLIFRRE